MPEFTNPLIDHVQRVTFDHLLPCLCCGAEWVQERYLTMHHADGCAYIAALDAELA